MGPGTSTRVHIQVFCNTLSMVLGIALPLQMKKWENCKSYANGKGYPPLKVVFTSDSFFLEGILAK